MHVFAQKNFSTQILDFRRVSVFRFRKDSFSREDAFFDVEEHEEVPKRHESLPRKGLMGCASLHSSGFFPEFKDCYGDERLSLRASQEDKLRQIFKKASQAVLTKSLLDMRLDLLPQGNDHKQGFLTLFRKDHLTFPAVTLPRVDSDEALLLEDGQVSGNRRTLGHGQSCQFAQRYWPPQFRRHEQGNLGSSQAAWPQEIIVEP